MTRLIRFPRDFIKIKQFGSAVRDFQYSINDMTDWLYEVSGGLLERDHHVGECTSQDVKAIHNAHKFASTSLSLFSQVLDGIKCGASHEAKLHLSGFKEDQLKMNIGTCQGTISTVFTP